MTTLSQHRGFWFITSLNALYSEGDLSIINAFGCIVTECLKTFHRQTLRGIASCSLSTLVEQMIRNIGTPQPPLHNGTYLRKEATYNVKSWK